MWDFKTKLNISPYLTLIERESGKTWDASMEEILGKKDLKK